MFSETKQHTKINKKNYYRYNKSDNLKKKF